MPSTPVLSRTGSHTQLTISRALLWILQRLCLTLDFPHINGPSIPPQTLCWVHFAFQQPSCLITKTTLVIFLTLMATSDKTEIYSLSQSTWGVKVRPFAAPFHSFVSKVKQQQSFTLLCFRHDSSIHHGDKCQTHCWPQ